MKVKEIIGVNKKGEPIEKEIENYDEQVARAEIDEIFDPTSLQHERKENKLFIKR